jgi:hypothetical protein
VNPGSKNYVKSLSITSSGLIASKLQTLRASLVSYNPDPFTNINLAVEATITNNKKYSYSYLQGIISP